MGRLRIKKKSNIPKCRKCNAKYKGNTYLIYKESYDEWICPRCGYIKRNKKEGDSNGDT